MKQKLLLCSYKICTLTCTIPRFWSTGVKLVVLKMLKVGLFCFQKWSEDWVEFYAEFQVVTSRWCQKFVYFYSVLAAEKDCRKRKACRAILWTIDSGNSLCYGCQQRNIALAVAYLSSLPPWWIAIIGTNVTSAVIVTWHFGRAIRMPFFKAK